MTLVLLLGSPPIVHNRDLIPYALIPSCHTPISFFLIIIIIIYSSTKQLILKYSISALKNLNVEFLLEFVQKEDIENLL